ncbi:50S ribosomal protein L18 [Candidatus Bandiella numerosa]|uniref:50S ribosomal protein L18 n=1 Tax=Candidatus Bandiella numerosa TaxID=2570586 RepID=UPI001F02958F|nr:50S ribosomal protein L18 [Candidatus Bandiella numerosa]
MLSKKLKHIRRKERTRFKLKSGNLDRLRLCFYTSNKYIYGQVIDESKRMTITSLATYDKDFKDFKNKNNIKAAELLGEKFAKMLLDRKIKDVYFDRGRLKYHGKAKAFADSARKNGLNF